MKKIYKFNSTAMKLFDFRYHWLLALIAVFLASGLIKVRVVNSESQVKMNNPTVDGGAVINPITTQAGTNRISTDKIREKPSQTEPDLQIPIAFSKRALSFQKAYNQFNRNKIRKSLLTEELANPGTLRAAQAILTNPKQVVAKFPEKQAELRIYAIEVLRAASNAANTTELEATLHQLGSNLDQYREENGKYWKAIDEDYIDLLSLLLKIKKPSSSLDELKTFIETNRISKATYFQFRRAWVRAFVEYLPTYREDELF